MIQTLKLLNILFPNKLLMNTNNFQPKVLSTIKRIAMNVLFSKPIRLRVVFLIFCLICINTTLLGQNFKGKEYLTIDDLINIQKSSLNVVKDFFSKTGWDFYSSEPTKMGYSFEAENNYNIITWACDESYNKARGWSTLMLHENYENIFIYQPVEKEYYNFLENEAKRRFKFTESNVSKENKIQTSYVTKNGISLWFTTTRDYSKNYYSIIVINENDYVKHIEELEMMKYILLLEAENEKKFNELINKGNSTFNEKNYEKALVFFYEAQEIKPFDNLVEEKIFETEKIIIKLAQYQTEIELGDESFNKKEYSQAKQHYENATIIFPIEIYPKNQIKEIEKVFQFLEERKIRVFDYSLINTSHWDSINKAIIYDISDFFYRDDMFFKGKLFFEYYIDTLGNSSLKSNSLDVSDQKIANNLISFGSKYSLKQVYKNDFSLNAKGIINLSLSFDKLTTFKVVKKDGVLIIKNDPNTIYSPEINKLLNNRNNGKYKVQIHYKKINEIDLSNNKITGYRILGGPSNAFLSLLVPGLGNKFVFENNERKGINIALQTYGCIGIGILSKYLSMVEYEKYMKASTQSEMDKYYENANYLNYAFYGLLGVSAIIWIDDIYKVALQGFKNKEKEKLYRKELNLF